MSENRAAYNSDEARWYKDIVDARLQPVGEGKQRHQYTPGVEALTYADAVTILFGHAPIIPAPVRTPKHPPVFA